YINTLPVRLNLDDTSVEASVRQTHAVLAELLRHEHASLALAQRCSGVAPPAPLFSALLNYRHNRVPTDANGAVDAPLDGVEWLSGEERTNYPFVLSVEDFGEALGLTAQVVQSVSAARACAMMERTLEQLAEALEQRPAAPVRTLDVLPSAERTLLLETWNATAAEYPSEQCIHQLFEAQVERTPDAIAVVQDDVALTYGELNSQANRLAHRLIERGVCVGDQVATLFARSVPLVVAELAILKAGAAYVPLDPDAPMARQAWMVADCEARVVVSDVTHAAGAELGAALLLIDSVPEGLIDTSNPELTVGSAAAAYVMYTSGSTGTPKGVVITHRGVNRLVCNNGYAEYLPSDRIAWIGNPAFDSSALEVWSALLNGACLVVVAYHDLLDMQMVRRVLQRQQVSVLNLTAALFHSFVDPLGDALGQLRLLMVGADVVDPNAVRRLLRDHRPQRLLHTYGPTESTTFSTTYEVVSAADADVARLSIGRPIANT
ncbi:MAG: AMP-binding protein, partial [Gemmatimonadaceae bacterium]